MILTDKNYFISMAWSLAMMAPILLVWIPFYIGSKLVLLVWIPFYIGSKLEIDYQLFSLSYRTFTASLPFIILAKVVHTWKKEDVSANARARGMSGAFLMAIIIVILQSPQFLVTESGDANILMGILLLLSPLYVYSAMKVGYVISYRVF